MKKYTMNGAYTETKELTLEERQRQWDELEMQQEKLRSQFPNCPIDIILPPRPTE